MFMFRSLIFLFCALMYSTGHEHDHAHEPPHLKYSEAANLGVKPVFVPPKQKLRTESAEQLWLETSGAVLLISLAPFVLLCLLPDLNKHQRLLKILLAFAAGGLLGDAFLHLIPHAVDRGHSEAHETGSHGHDHHDHRHHLVVGISILSGIFVFLCIEKVIRLVQNGSHGHSHSSKPNAELANGNAENAKGKKGKNKQQNAPSEATGHKEGKKVAKGTKEFRVSGYLNLAADFTHNFTDGLAIGASFLISRQLGLVTTMTVLLHELPHEIGDYAILIQSGCSARKAMFLQLTTALGAAAGAALSLLVAGLGPQSITLFSKMPSLTDDMINSCILPFTAGGFIYIAMTSVLPDLLVDIQPRPGFFMRLVQNVSEMCALVFGIGMMAALGAME